ncbi:hypothetical protein [Cyclobacterium lianum]|uniref:hypothetical protein n=1 Tax=Cyclobacterium lianum TaxID=388280 RepID=UPI0011601DDB|nr:hypothetical protein [Cyclobacterium lianum]
MKWGRKNITTICYRNIFTNLLAVFLIGLSVAEGEEAIHQFPAPGIHIDVSEFDFVDFPTSLNRSFAGNQQNRDLMLPSFYLRYNPFHLLLLLHAVTPDTFPPFFTPDHIRQIVSLFVWTNAP